MSWGEASQQGNVWILSFGAKELVSKLRLYKIRGRTDVYSVVAVTTTRSKSAKARDLDHAQPIKVITRTQVAIGVTRHSHSKLRLPIAVNQTF